MRKPYVVVFLVVLGIAANWLARNAHAPAAQTQPPGATRSVSTASGSSEADVRPSAAPPQRRPSESPRTDESAADQRYALDSVPADERDELRQTLAAIDAGGPFRYPKDGATFGNYERQLPQQRRGYYREYTVATPAAHDRGARRVIRGRGGETYYTNDHYRSFARIDGGRGKN